MKKYTFIIFILFVSLLGANTKILTSPNRINPEHITLLEDSQNNYSSRETTLSYWEDTDPLYYWDCPNEFGDTEFGMRYTAPSNCNLTGFNIMLDLGGERIGPSGVTIHVYDCDYGGNPSGLPDSELGSVYVPYDSIILLL